jgi:hypothetical protein
MPRTLSTSTAAETVKRITTPGYLIEILFAVPVRFSTRGTQVWRGNTWTQRDVKIQGLGIDASQSNQSGRLIFDDTDNAITALIDNEGIADRAINAWQFWGAALADADPVQIFGGVGDATDWPDEKSVVVSVEQGGASSLYSPRAYITAELGFSALPAPGQIINWNGENFELVAGE